MSSHGFINLIFPEIDEDRCKPVGSFKGKPAQCSGFFLFTDNAEEKKIKGILAVSGPICITDQDSNKANVIFFQETSFKELGMKKSLTFDSFKKQTPLPTKLTDQCREYEKDLSGLSTNLKFSNMLEDSNVNERYSLTSQLYEYYTKALSHRIKGFSQDTVTYGQDSDEEDEVAIFNENLDKEDISKCSLEIKYIAQEMEKITDEKLTRKVAYLLLKKKAKLFALENYKREETKPKAKIDNKVIRSAHKDLQKLKTALSSLEQLFYDSLKDKIAENLDTLHQKYTDYFKVDE